MNYDKWAIVITGAVLIAFLCALIFLAARSSNDFNFDCEKAGGVPFHSQRGSICIRSDAVIK